MTEGYLLDLYQDGPWMVLWLKVESGVRVFRHRFTRPLYILPGKLGVDEAASMVGSHPYVEGVSVERKQVGLKGCIRDVVRVDVSEARHVYEIISRFRYFDPEAEFYYHDIPADIYYLYVNGVMPASKVLVDDSSDGTVKGLRQVEDDRVDYDPPPFTIAQAGDEDIERLVEDLDPDIIVAPSSMVYGVRGVCRDSLRSPRMYGRYVRVYGRVLVDPDLALPVGLHGLYELSRVSMLPLSRAASARLGVFINSAEMYEAYRRGILIPRRSGMAEQFRSGLSMIRCDRGGLHLQCKPGVYWMVAEYDYVSLYPSIMAKMNISPETVNCECCRRDASRVPGLDYWVCTRRRGLVSNVVSRLLERRRKLRPILNRAYYYRMRDSALKWMLCACFGYLGYRKARFGRVEGHQCISAYAREVMLRSVEVARGRGLKVIYGVVDSIFVEGGDVELYRRLPEELELATGFDVRLENIYRWIVFLESKKVRGVAALSRYYGRTLDGRIVVRGIELRRRSAPMLIKRLQESIIKVLSGADTPGELYVKGQECLELIENWVDGVKNGKVRSEELAFRVRLSRGSYASMQPYYKAALKLKREGFDVRPGQYVEYIFSPSGPIPLKLADEGWYDREYYARLTMESALQLIRPILMLNSKL